MKEKMTKEKKIKLPKMNVKFDGMKKIFVRVGNFFKNLFIKSKSLDVRAKLESKIYKRISLVAGIVFLALAIYIVVIGVMIYGFKSQAKVVTFTGRYIPYPVAVVNYDFVTYGDYLAEADYISHFYKATQMDGSVDFKEIDKQIVDQLIENKVIAAEAIKYKITVSKDDENQVIDGVIQQNGGQDKVEKILNQMYGINLARFRQLVDIQILRDKLDTKVIAKVTVQHILINVAANASAADIATAKSKIDDIRNQITNGSISFDDAAKKYSEDSSSAPNGGALDPFSQGDMVKEFGDAAFNTKVGDISQPVKTVYGWHIIKVNSRTGILVESFTDWLTSLKSKSLILRLYKI